MILVKMMLMYSPSIPPSRSKSEDKKNKLSIVGDKLISKTLPSRSFIMVVAIENASMIKPMKVKIRNGIFEFVQIPSMATSKSE